MEKKNLSEFTNGWIVGNFTPSVIKTDSCEVGIQSWSVGDYSESHVHLITNETNLVLNGLVEFKIQKMNSDEIPQVIQLKKNELLTIPSGYVTRFLSITDSTLLIIKDQSKTYDKVIWNSFFISS